MNENEPKRGLEVWLTCGDCGHEYQPEDRGPNDHPDKCMNCGSYNIRTTRF